jgi:hypothetical protein
MEFEAIRAAIMKLEAGEQRRLVLELLPEIWPNLVGDEACLKLLRKLLDAATVKEYREEHMDHL